MNYDEVLFKRALPLLAALVAAIGGACFTIFAPADSMDRFNAVSYSIAGIAGTAGLVGILRALLRLPSSWNFYNLSRNLLVVLICLCWTFGAVSGFILFCVMPR